jgi:hypothetical protein
MEQNVKIKCPAKMVNYENIAIYTLNHINKLYYFSSQYDEKLSKDYNIFFCLVSFNSSSTLNTFLQPSNLSV